MSPRSEADGGDTPWLGFDFAPSVAAMFDDVVVAFEDTI
jgi:hypothetical protein